MERNMIVGIILVLLIILSLSQTLQLRSLRVKITESVVSGGRVVQQVSSGRATQPSSVLPRMVGGC